MKKQKIWMWAIASLAGILLISIIWPLIINARRPKQLSFKIRSIYTQTATAGNAFSISGMTQDFVVAEGPCGGNDCNGGILSQQPPADLKNYIPTLQGYDGESTSVIWLYQVKPTEITRRNDLFGDDTVTITGTLTKAPKVYFAVVPRQLVAPHLQWVFVETE